MWSQDAIKGLLKDTKYSKCSDARAYVAGLWLLPQLLFSKSPIDYKNTKNGDLPFWLNMVYM